jgi:hypothetical protein
MATKTGFIVFSTNKDLSEIFEPIGSDTPGPNTGYVVLSSGKDLSQLFKPYVSGTKASNTGFKLADRVTDLCDVFVPIKIIMFTLSTLENYSTGVPFSGFIWGTASANLGIGYVSAYQQTTGSPPILFKTTNFGANFSKIPVPNGGIRGVATNQSDNMLAISYAGTNRSIYSTNGGNTFSNFGSSALHQSCIMSRNRGDNFIIQNVDNSASYTWAQPNYTTNNSYTVLPNSSITNNISGANSISDRPNLLVTTRSGLHVYRNFHEAVITTASTGTNVAVVINNEDATANYVGTCCNATNTKHFIVNRTTGTTGGRIYFAPVWDFTFGSVAGSPIALWRQIATSSDGKIVCAIADTLIYLSSDYGVTWSNIPYTPALQSSEIFRFVTVSPDEKFIIIGTNGTTAMSRIFYYIL